MLSRPDSPVGLVSDLHVRGRKFEIWVGHVLCDKMCATSAAADEAASYLK